MRRLLNYLLFVMVLIVLGIVYARPDWIVMPPIASAATCPPDSAKCDEPCTGHETTGRCADKCPPPTYLQGYAQDGSAICNQPPTGCPTADHAPLDKCPAAPTTQESTSVYNAGRPAEPFAGK